MHILIARTAYCDTAPLEAILESSGCRRTDEQRFASEGGRARNPAKALAKLPDPALIPAHAIGGIEAIEHWLKASDTTHLLAFQTPPETAIAEAIAQEGSTLDDAVDAWAESARKLLHAIRRNRKRTTLFEASAARANPGAFGEKVAEHLTLGVNKAAPQQSRDPESSRAALYRVIAAQAVAQSQDLQDLRDELEASAIPLAGAQAADAPDCNQALADLRKQQHLEEENELLLLQLHQVQEELETYYLENQKMNKDQKEIERLKGEVKRLAEQRDWAKHHMEKMKNSKSWKITAPLRGLRGGKGSAKPSAGA